LSLLQLQNIAREKVVETAQKAFNITLEAVACEVPPKTELGDLAFPVAFELAKRIKQETGEKKNPREIAEALKNALEAIPEIAKAEVAGAGYLNLFFDRSQFLAGFISSDALPNAQKQFSPQATKRMVEHTSVNPNKAAHIGHVRNSVLGDTLVRILRANGDYVEVQNYIDNTGVQVADVVVGFMHIEKMSLEDIKRLDANLSEKGQSFDYYCWDLYTRVGRFYLENEENKKLQAQVLRELEAGDNETAKLADYVATRNVECILRTMERLDIRYDLLPRESEILHLHFWQHAFEKMKQLGVIKFEIAGKNAGCWVMPFGEHTGTEEHDADKILVRSNGIVTYTGKDIAYQLWKLGLLGLDFNYKLFHFYHDNKEVWVTTTEETVARNVPKFGGGETVFNVIDSRQSYPQEIVRKGVAAISPERGEKASVHLSYEMVALSPAAAAELGFTLSDEDKTRPFIEMSGRKGLGVKADDMIDRLEQNALAEVEKRHPDASENEKKNIAHIIAVGALRYFLLKFTRSTIIVFDFAEALSFDGETGPYCQYAAVRANSVFRKLEEGGLEKAKQLVMKNGPAVADISALFESEDGTDVWALITLAGRLEETIGHAVAQAEPAILAKFTFNLAKAFNLFYHHHKILAEENAAKRAVLVCVADIARKQLTAALNTLGIEVPEKM
jgi:arginyl-tRNA synthetase